MGFCCARLLSLCVLSICLFLDVEELGREEQTPAYMCEHPYVQTSPDFSGVLSQLFVEVN